MRFSAAIILNIWKNNPPEVKLTGLFALKTALIAFEIPYYLMTLVCIALTATSYSLYFSFKLIITPEFLEEEQGDA